MAVKAIRDGIDDLNELPIAVLLPELPDLREALIKLAILIERASPANSVEL